MSRRVQIDAQPRFFEQTNQDDCCPICFQHKFIIVQKFPAYYAMHTWLAEPTDSAHCLHAWRTREADPICLRCFKPTDHIASRKVSFNSLYVAVRDYHQNNNEVQQAARDRIREAVRDEAPNPVLRRDFVPRRARPIRLGVQINNGGLQ